MTPGEIRVKVAEAMGWTWKPFPWGLIKVSFPSHPTGASRVPDYPSDLNACADFEATLTDEEKHDYFYALNDVLDLASPRSFAWILEHACFMHTTATPRQRCEAFLRVKGVWK